MPASAPARSARRPLDPTALARQQRRLLTAAEPPWLHGEVARRMAERLPVIKLQPQCVVDWGAFVGASQAVLAAACPRAQCIAVEPDAARRDATAALLQPAWWSARRWHRAPQAMLSGALPAGAAQLVWSNMGLQGEIDPQRTMAAWHRVLVIDGFLMFSTLGPGTLTTLQALYTQAGWPPPMAPLVDMHDLGDMLIEAGFADPVMDQETVTLTWPSPQALLAELRQLGGNVDPRRAAGLRTPRWREQLHTRLQRLAPGNGPDSRIGLPFEIVYGHAFRPPPRPRLTARTEVPLEDLRAMARRTPPRG
ncbi:MAG: biotin synthase [Rubrivivax sp.]|nr:biotin synthase [Rubrivivax sp.]